MEAVLLKKTNGCLFRKWGEGGWDLWVGLRLSLQRNSQIRSIT
jgi:hypothetical protein